MRLTWHHGFLEPNGGEAEVPATRQAVVGQIQTVLPEVRLRPEWVTFTPLGDGRTQVNIHGFGPFGVCWTDRAEGGF